ncbi:hypothetical protein CLOM_g13363 [Closterium sp. NIES-68]|nr:hypothetical protein CLOM_g12649 [Closterium sp. NIES-68]GJP54253.1 hypothetical protein CLOM_g13363 [Closterium sp. NIES-68]GJP70413.1 hypothetical protein CLOP_g1357 [Closterium sp. NIES-67]
MNPPEWALDVDTSTPQNAPVSFAIRSSVLKELIEDLEWPGASVRISINPQPAGVTFLAQGHGDLQVDLLVGRCNNLFVDFKCHRPISFLYRYKHLSAATTSIPAAVLKENHASKLTIDCHGLLRVQHVVNMRATGPSGRHANEAPDAQGVGSIPAFSQPTQDGSQALHNRSARTSFVELFVAPQEEDYEADEV